MYSRNRFVPIITYTLLAVQIAIFLLETINGGSYDTNTLVMYGAKANVLIADGDWWRLISPMFVHIGFTQILINSLMLFYGGSRLEEYLGHSKFIVVYFISGVFGNLASFAFGPDNLISAGATNAVFGLLASYIALAYLNESDSTMQMMGKQFLILMILNLVIDLLFGNIDIWSQIGGVIGGLLITVIISKKFSEKQNILLRSSLTLVLLILVVFLYSHGMRSIVF